MESKIETLLQESLILAEKKIKDDNIVQKFERTKNEFQELVVKGLAHERGNNLLSVSDKQFVTRIVFNAK